MRKTLCLLLCLITILGLWLPCGATAASKTGEIHKFVPKVEEYYPGFEDYIAKALRNKEKMIHIGEFGVSTDNIIYAFKSAVFDNPDVFYVDASIINYKFDNRTGIVEYITPTYLCKLSSIPSKIKKFEKAVKQYTSGIKSSWSNFQKALVLHDRIAVGCAYKDTGALAYTAYGALVKEKAICEGYARAYSYLLSLVGVDSKIINNDSTRHCWHCVRIGKSWYQVDVTADDPRPDVLGYVRHKFFLCTDSGLLNSSSKNYKGFRSDVTFSKEYSCSSSKYNTSFVKRIVSQVIVCNNAYYYLDNNYGGKYKSALIRRKNGKKKTLRVINDIWYYAGKYEYEDSFCKLCAKDNKIYFNTKRSVYAYNLKTKKFRRIHKLAGFVSKHFYGIALKGSAIYTTRYDSKMKTKSATKFIKLNSGKAVVIPYRQYKSVSLKKRAKFTFKIYGGSGKTSFKSSSKKIARVNGRGVVKARKKGKCTITAIKNRYKFKLIISVK